MLGDKTRAGGPRPSAFAQAAGPAQPVRWVAAVDVAYGEPGAVAAAAAVLWDAREACLVEVCFHSCEGVAEYVPGAFWQREGEVAAAAVRALTHPADVVLCDGHGTAHPHRFGLACWLEERLLWPVVGCAKSRLVGTFGELPLQAGSWVPLQWHGETVGAVVRTCTNVRPLFVSPGGRWNLEACVEVVLQTCRGARLPEPLRAADRYARQALHSILSSAGADR